MKWTEKDSLRLQDLTQEIISISQRADTATDQDLERRAQMAAEAGKLLVRRDTWLAQQCRRPHDRMG